MSAQKANLDVTIDRVVSEIKHNGELFHSEQEDRRIARVAYRQAQKEQKEKELALRKEVRSL